MAFWVNKRLEKNEHKECVEFKRNNVKKKSKALNDLGLFIRSLPGWTQEHKFHPVRRWRFDFANVSAMVAVEFEGGVFRAGGGWHQSIGRMQGDMFKYNEAAILGWRVLRFCAPMVKSGEAFRMIEETIKNACK